MAKKGDGWLVGRWVAKLVANLLDTAALWVRIQTFLKNTKAKECTTHSSLQKYTKRE
jgi:hypothetical protein